MSRESDPPDEERLEALLRIETWKARVAATAEPDPARIADGWERRFVADGGRADEMMALYRELGFEVCADPVDPKELDEGCRQCALVAAFRFQTIYTRRPGRGGAPGEPSGGEPDPVEGEAPGNEKSNPSPVSSWPDAQEPPLHG